MIVSSTSDERLPAIGGVRRWRPQPDQAGQREQEPGGDRVELAHVPEREMPEGTTPASTARTPGQTRPIPPWRSSAMSSMLSRRRRPCPDQRGHLQPRVGALVRRHAQMLIGEVGKPRPLRQRHGRDQSRGGHEIRVVERRRRRSQSVRESHPRGALQVEVLEPSQVPISSTAGHFVVTAALTRPTSSVDRG